jgi:hypothetical protein
MIDPTHMAPEAPNNSAIPAYDSPLARNYATQLLFHTYRKSISTTDYHVTNNSDVTLSTSMYTLKNGLGMN